MPISRIATTNDGKWPGIEDAGGRQMYYISLYTIYNNWIIKF